VARLISPLRVGSRLGPLTLTGISGVRLGAASLTLQARGGATLQVDLCARDLTGLALEPVAATRHYDLFLANGGRGRAVTRARLSRVARRIALIVAANEERIPRLDLLTLRQRLGRHPGGRFDARS